MFEAKDQSGFTMHEGELGHLLIKFVPIRGEADFTNFPVHQLGFTVPDLERVIRIAENHGGRLLEHLPATDHEPARAAIRDPDGNSIELYALR